MAMMSMHLSIFTINDIYFVRFVNLYVENPYLIIIISCIATSVLAVTFTIASSSSVTVIIDSVADY